MMSNQSSHKKILIVAGEASGDLLGANLATSILHQDPSVTLIGMGGSKMRKAGVNILVNADNLAVVGITEVLTHIGDIFRAMRSLKRLFRNDPPNLVILIDYPGFNLRLAKHAKRAGIKVLYYSAPQIWAWRDSRIKKIKKYVDRMAVLFSFEKTLYQKAKMPVSFVGHPIVDIAKPSLSKEAIYTKFQLDAEKSIIALFPGSRHCEISRLMPAIQDAVLLIRQQLPDAQFVLPLASNLSENELSQYNLTDITIVKNNTYNILSVCHAAITASGTATLEIALHNVPMLIIYKVAPFSYFLGKLLLKLNCIGLCNIVAEDQVAQELIQHEVTPEAIAKETIQLIRQADYRASTLAKLTQVRTKLGEGQASERAANTALELLLS